MVNEGPLKICETFLPPNAIDPDISKPYDPHLIATLKGTFFAFGAARLLAEPWLSPSPQSENMSAFVRMCGFAIRLSKSLISSEHIPFQNMVESKYLTLKETVSKYIEDQ